MRLALTHVFLIIAITSSRLLAEDSEPIEMSIQPRAIESPALKYRLLPSEMDKKSGNAVPILLRLPWDQAAFMSTEFPKFHEWNDRGLDDPAWATSDGVLPAKFYGEMKRAAYRREAIWEYPIGEVPSPYMILLPDVQGLRAWLSFGLSARIRYHITQGELDQAREGIMVGLANSRHISCTPFYVVQAVAASIDRVMLDRIDELISQTNSPNLYWALSDLPDSLLEMGRAASLESEIFASPLPAFRDFDRPRDAKEWTRMALQLEELLKELGDLPQKAQEGNIDPESTFFSRLVKQKEKADQAKADLSKLTGVSDAQLSKMSDDELGLRWFSQLRIAYDQKLAVVVMLSPRDAWPELVKLDADIKSIQEKTDVKPNYFHPGTLFINSWTLKRKIQAQRIIEAVRHHLATHQGKLPASLDEIKDIPIPLDPLHDLPFTWKVDGKTATLKSAAIPANAVIPESTVDDAFKVEFARNLEYRLNVE